MNKKNIIFIIISIIILNNVFSTTDTYTWESDDEGWTYTQGVSRGSHSDLEGSYVFDCNYGWGTAYGYDDFSAMDFYSLSFYMYAPEAGSSGVNHLTISMRNGGTSHHGFRFQNQAGADGFYYEENNGAGYTQLGTSEFDETKYYYVTMEETAGGDLNISVYESDSYDGYYQLIENKDDISYTAQSVNRIQINHHDDSGAPNDESYWDVVRISDDTLVTLPITVGEPPAELFDGNFIYYNNSTWTTVEHNTNNTILITTPIIGNYTGTDTFDSRNETDDNPINSTYFNWTFTETPEYDTYIAINDTYLGHNNVLHIYDNNDTGFLGSPSSSSKVYFNDDFTIGTVEFWLVGVDLGDDSMFVSIGENGLIDNAWGVVQINNSLIQVYTCGDLVDCTTRNYFTIEQNNNTWNHYRFDINESAGDDGNGTTTFYFNGVNQGTYEAISPLASTVDVMHLGSVFTGKAEFYLDALSITEDENYTLGDNWNLQYINTTITMNSTELGLYQNITTGESFQLNFSNSSVSTYPILFYNPLNESNNETFTFYTYTPESNCTFNNTNYKVGENITIQCIDNYWGSLNETTLFIYNLDDSTISNVTNSIRWFNGSHNITHINYTIQTSDFQDTLNFSVLLNTTYNQHYSTNITKEWIEGEITINFRNYLGNTPTGINSTIQGFGTYTDNPRIINSTSLFTQTNKTNYLDINWNDLNYYTTTNSTTLTVYENTTEYNITLNQNKLYLEFSEPVYGRWYEKNNTGGSQMFGDTELIIIQQSIQIGEVTVDFNVIEENESFSQKYQYYNDYTTNILESLYVINNSNNLSRCYLKIVGEDNLKLDQASVTIYMSLNNGTEYETWKLIGRGLTDEGMMDFYIEEGETANIYIEKTNYNSKQALITYEQCDETTDLYRKTITLTTGSLDINRLVDYTIPYTYNENTTNISIFSYGQNINEIKISTNYMESLEMNNITLTLSEKGGDNFYNSVIEKGTHYLGEGETISIKVYKDGVLSETILVYYYEAKVISTWTTAMRESKSLGVMLFIFGVGLSTYLGTKMKSETGGLGKEIYYTYLIIGGMLNTYLLPYVTIPIIIILLFGNKIMERIKQ